MLITTTVVMVKKHEESCVVGGGEGEVDTDAFRARYCVELYLKDVGARCNHFHSLRWLGLEHVNLLLPVKFYPLGLFYLCVCVCGLTTRPRACFLSRSLFLFSEKKIGWMPVFLFAFFWHRWGKAS